MTESTIPAKSEYRDGATDSTPNDTCELVYVAPPEAKTPDLDRPKRRKWRGHRTDRPW